MPALSLEQKMSRAFADAVAFGGLGPEQSICFRNVLPKYATPRDFLSTAGSLFAGGRYNFNRAFGVLYLSCDPHTCLEETTRVTAAGNFRAAENFPRTFIGIRVRLSKVLDLTNARVRRGLGVSQALLVADGWELLQTAGREAPTQELGRLARAAGFEAVLTPSAAWGGHNLNVFPDNLLPSSDLSLVNPQRLKTTPAGRKRGYGAARRP